MEFTSTHDILTLVARNNAGVEANINFLLCKEVRFLSSWQAGHLRAMREPGEYMRLSDGVLDVVCRQAQRWCEASQEKISFTFEDIC
jgi:hypothetical protein